MKSYIKFSEKIFMPNIIEIEVTKDCNLKCYHCNRRSTQHPSKEGITDKAIDKFLKDSENSYNLSGFVWDKIRILGGEPTVFPKLLPFIEKMKPYCDKYGASLELWTNGWGDSIEKLSAIPKWVRIENSHKLSTAIWYHSKCDLAPVDYGLKIEKDDLCYTKESFRNFVGTNRSMEKICGLVYTNLGYYVCGSGSAIDAIFKLDLAYNTVEELIADLGDKQYNSLCQLCGEAYKMRKYAEENNLKEWESKSWAEKFGRKTNEK